MSVIEVEPKEVAVVLNQDCRRVIETNGVIPTIASQLQTRFGPFFAAVEGLLVEAAQIKVTDAKQVEEIGRAREMRLKLRKVRTEAEKARKELKEDSLRVGKAIDGINNVLLLMIEPVENRLQAEEEFAVRQEAERLDALEAGRNQKLRQYCSDPSIFKTRNMSDLEFNQILEGQRLVHLAQVERERQEAKAREEAEAARAAEDRRIREENERLNREAAEREEAARVEREAAQAERERIEAEARAERERLEADARREREAAATAARLQREEDARLAKIEQDRLAEEARVAREAAAKLERENAARLAAEKKQKAAEALAAKKAAQAPEAEKLRALAKAYAAIPLPTLSTPQGIEDIGDIHIQIRGLIKSINDMADGLENGQ